MKPTKLSNILDAINLQNNMLLKTGTWPIKNPIFTYRLKHYLAWTIDITFQYFLFIELYTNYQRGEFKEMTELLSFMASEVSYLLKHICFDLNSKKFLKALDVLQQPMFNDYPQVCDKYVQRTIKFARIFMRAYQFVVINLVLLYFLKPFFSDQMAIRFSVFEMGSFKWVFHLYQVLSIACACYNNSTLDILALGIISIGSAQFEILRDKITNASKWAGLTNSGIDNGSENDELEMNEQLDNNINKYLGECCQHHLGILEYIDHIEAAYTLYFLVQFADSILAICNTWFQFMLEDKFIKIIFLGFYTITLLMQLAMYCIYGNILMIRSEEIQDACYFSKWYNSGIKVRKSLMLIMERSKRSSMLTAGKISFLTMTTYMVILKTSYSYFALMNHLNGK